VLHHNLKYKITNGGILLLHKLIPCCVVFVPHSGKAGAERCLIRIQVVTQRIQAGVKMHHSEGYSTGTWILLDFGNLLIHLFNEEQREFYGLEHVWGDAKPVE